MLKCNSKNPKFKNLTIGKDYEGEIDGDFAEVTNDAGVKARYNRRYFEDVPLPVRVRTLSLEDILESIETEVFEEEIGIECSLNNSSTEVSYNRTSNTCGILEIQGMNSVYNFCDYILSHIDQDDELTTSVNISELYDAVMMNVLSALHEDRAIAFYMLTTNNPNREGFGAFNSRFEDHHSWMSEQRINPNSSNPIAVWIIDVETFFS